MIRKLPTLTTAAVAAAALLASAPVMAGHGYNDRYDDRYDDRDGIEYATVVSSTPIYREVRVNTPRQECHDERVVYRDQGYRGGNGANVLVGAILGGVAGHQFGSGRGNAAATAAGALIGASVGANHSRGGYVSRDRVAYEPVCTTYDDYRIDQRVEGYDVAYKLNGRVYHTRMSHDPGNRIPVRVDVSPVNGY